MRDHEWLSNTAPVLYEQMLLLLLLLLLRFDECSEISCNVKWNVYLAMEIPDRVSFVSGQNSDEIVRSCELSW